MYTEAQHLPDDIEALKGIIVTQSKEFHAVQSHINALEEKIRYLQGKLFGRRSEKHVLNDDSQVRLFDEPEDAVDQEAVSEEEEIIVPAHRRKKPGRKPLPEDLPRVDVIHDLKEEEKVCGCGSIMNRMGEEVSEKLDIIPSKVQVIRHIRYKYACKNCEGVESDEGAVKTAPLPAQLIPQGIATSGLLAHIITSKFVDSLPFYRQEKMFERIGVDLSRKTMASWVIQVADRCKPLIELLSQEIRSGPLINMDETTVQVLKEPGRSNTTKSYMWVFRGGLLNHPVIIYQYHPTRASKVAHRGGRWFQKDFRDPFRKYI